MAGQLIRDMSGEWNPDDYADKFTHAIHDLAAQRVKAGKTEKVTSLEGEAAAPASNVVDLTELLKKSLESRKGSKPEQGRCQGGAGCRQDAGAQGRAGQGEQEREGTPRSLMPSAGRLRSGLRLGGLVVGRAVSGSLMARPSDFSGSSSRGATGG